MKYTFEKRVEFYITNVCNLTCDNCNRFNNHKFTGWQRWSDYADIYQQWSENVNLTNIVIMGGEPLLNPTVAEWITGLRKIFKCGVQILSNGLQLKHNPELYYALWEMQHFDLPAGNIEISLHNLDHFETIKNNIKNFLQDPVEEFGIGINVPHKDDPDAYYSVRDVNNVLVRVHLANEFHEAAIQRDDSGRFNLYNSRPIDAHTVCGFAKFKCYHFIRGKLYKCGPVALMPEFDKQFNLNISEEDRQLLNSYEPLTIDHWPDRALEWIEKLDDPISQCKFCPSGPGDYKVIYPMVKNSKVLGVPQTI